MGFFDSEYRILPLSSDGCLSQVTSVSPGSPSQAGQGASGVSPDQRVQSLELPSRGSWDFLAAAFFEGDSFGSGFLLALFARP